jgi:hypothetical protein
MDKPIYTDCLKYIRESVVYDVNNILTPQNQRKHFLRVIAICVIIGLKTPIMRIYSRLIIFEIAIQKCVKRDIEKMKNFRVIFQFN